MSGIAGLMSRDGSVPPGAPLRAMAHALGHRGPDGEGRYRAADLAMIQTRLATIDPATGDQPLFDPGGAAVIADSAIDNHAELRGDFPDAMFSSLSDCEPALALYRRHGLDFAGHLRGGYAVALHDPATGGLVLARDPFGLKPLYFIESPAGFAFASEPQALVAAGLVTPALSTPTTSTPAVSGAARSELLQMQFTTGRDTIFAAIQRVLPGETVVVRRGRIVERRRREGLPSGTPLRLDEEDALAQLDSLLAEAVRRQSQADAPLGLLLSGAVNAAALLVMLARQARRPLRVLSLRFASPDPEKQDDPAGAVARALAAETIEAPFSESDFWRLLPAVATALDDPAADPVAVPIYALGAAARQAGIKVVLSGQGADEVFGGYGRYRSVMRPWWAGGRMPRARGFLDGLGVLRSEIAGWRDGIGAAEARNTIAGRSRLQVAQAVDCADWLSNDLLATLDRCLMAHGVEGRAPFLDPDLAGFGFSLPDELKIRRGLGKYLLRRWLDEHVPEARAFERGRGATIPVGTWIAARAPEIGPLVAASAAVRELCDPDAVRRVFAAAAQKRPGRAAWTLLFYALWHRRHIAGIELPPDTLAALAEPGAAQSASRQRNTSPARNGATANSPSPTRSGTV